MDEPRPHPRPSHRPCRPLIHCLQVLLRRIYARPSEFLPAARVQHEEFPEEFRLRSTGGSLTAYISAPPHHLQIRLTPSLVCLCLLKRLKTDTPAPSVGNHATNATLVIGESIGNESFFHFIVIFRCRTPWLQWRRAHGAPSAASRCSAEPPHRWTRGPAMSVLMTRPKLRSHHDKGEYGKDSRCDASRGGRPASERAKSADPRQWTG